MQCSQRVTSTAVVLFLSLCVWPQSYVNLLLLPKKRHVGFTFLIKGTPCIFTRPHVAFTLPLTLPSLRLTA